MQNISGSMMIATALRTIMFFIDLADFRGIWNTLYSVLCTYLELLRMYSVHSFSGRIEAEKRRCLFR